MNAAATPPHESIPPTNSLADLEAAAADGETAPLVAPAPPAQHHDEAAARSAPTAKVQMWTVGVRELTGRRYEVAIAVEGTMGDLMRIIHEDHGGPPPDCQQLLV